MRGFNEIAPPISYVFEHIKKVFEKHALLHAFDFVNLNLIEEADLYFRTSGEQSDICNKELFEVRRYKDEFRNWVLRPEGTASCMRYLKETNYLQDQREARFAYFGPMFRYNRPQKGRYRQFYHGGLEMIGNDSIYTDLELVQFAYKFLKELNLDFELEINSIGSIQDRSLYREVLRKKFDLADDVDSLKILDKNDDFKDIPHLILNEKSAQRFKDFTNLLGDQKIAYTHNPYLVRGLDYYNDLVFEFKVEGMSVLAGGRYDGLMEQIQGPSVPAVGFGAGIDRIMLHSKYAYENEKIALISLNANECAYEIMKTIQKSNKIAQPFWGWGVRDLKKFFTYLDKQNYKYAIIAGESEVLEGKCTFKNLKTHEQQEVYLKELNSFLENLKS
jgi:histidyl-tRNA synthetase